MSKRKYSDREKAMYRGIIGQMKSSIPAFVYGLREHDSAHYFYVLVNLLERVAVRLFRHAMLMDGQGFIDLCRSSEVVDA